MSKNNEINPDSPLLDIPGRIGAIALELDHIRQQPNNSITVGEMRLADYKKRRALRLAAELIELPRMFLELNYLSQGFQERETADMQNCDLFTVKARRRRIKQSLGTRTRNETVFCAIHAGIIGIKPETLPTRPALNPVEEAVLYRAASGWTTSEIASKYQITANTIDRYYEMLREKLGGRNMPHVIRRAFELGIFKVGQEIPNLDDQPVLLVTVAGHTSDSDSLGIVHPAELEVLKAISRLDKGIFTPDDLLGLGIYSEFSPGRRKILLGKIVSRLSKKLEVLGGEPVFGKPRTRRRGESREYVYSVMLPLVIGSPDFVKEVPVAQAKDLPLSRPVGRPPNMRIIKNPPEPTILKNPMPKQQSAKPSGQEEEISQSSQASIQFWRAHAEVLKKHRRET